MRKILAFCFFPAFVPPSNGGQSRLFNFYRALSRWHQITLLTSTHIGGEEEVINHGLNFVERRIPKDDHFVREYAALEAHSGGGDLSGPAIAASGGLPTRLHQAYLEEYEKAEALFFDDPFTGQYDLFAGTDDKPRIYNSYNCESLLYAQLHPGEKSQPIHELVRAAEERMLQNADLVLYCNKDDLLAFRELAPEASFDALYAPNGMTPVAPKKNSRPEGKAFRTVFMGSGHPPNAEAADFIVRRLAPALPEVSFDILGSCLKEGSYPDNVCRHGVVDDASKNSLLGSAAIALNPMAAGSGSNVKVLEYFAHGLPVLSTSFGMRGIQAETGRDYLEASLDHFAEVLRRVACIPSELASVGAAGHELALKRYSWEAIAGPVAKRVDALVNGRGGNDPRRFVLALNDYDSFAGIGGGGTRTRGLYEAVGDWSPVVFISYSNGGALMARRHDAVTTVINVPKTAKHIADQARVNAQFHVSADDIVASRHCTANPWLQAIYRVLRQSARCIVAEHCYMAGLPLAWGDRFIYSSQNNETTLKQRLLEGHPLKAELVAEVERIERLAVEHSAATIAVSQEDAESLVKGKRAAGQVIVVRNGAAFPAAGEAVGRSKQDLGQRIGDQAVVFLGSAHMPNIDAARFIVDRLAPALPEVRFHVLGSVCSCLTKAPTNVHLWGVVDEVTKSAVMQSCALALNPMQSGSGSNVKLADYLGNGLFVVTTDFGQRGYPASVQPHLKIVAVDDGFADAVLTVLGQPQLYSAEAKADRRELFERELAMRGIAGRFVETLQALEKKKKRVLYVAYRYVAPAHGGAEANIEKFVSALGNSGEFDVDVVAPEISGIHNHLRFSEAYSFDVELGVPVDIPNVRFARFPADVPFPKVIDGQLRKAWSAQPNFEQAVDRSLCEHYLTSGLTWGWGYPECEGLSAARWAFAECGLHLAKAARVELEGYAQHSVVTTVFDGDRMVGGPWSLKGAFTLSFQAEVGELRWVSSCAPTPVDPRPLAFRVSRLSLDGHALDLSAPTLLQQNLPTLPAEQSFRLLDQAAQVSRVQHGVRLTDGRGPWSGSLERFITDHVADYDLVVTHNNVFRPTVMAIEAAKAHGVPSILIPHAHLDDDFYHFPDWMESARDASLVLAVPKAACDFLAEKGCNVRYLPAGCDAAEAFTRADQEAFQQVHRSSQPFVLVLGRKAGAKGYRQIIEAIEQLNREGVDLQAVLIGPDDDGLAVDSPNAVYLGRQPRNVVRGALLSCVALCNMSSSESFGIVLLEAWMAGKPVIANRNCAAFHDMAMDGENALLVDAQGLSAAIASLVQDPDRCVRLAEKGREKVSIFSWQTVCERFVDYCQNLPQDLWR